MKYADRNATTIVRDDDGDEVELRTEPSGSDYDRRVSMMGNMRLEVEAKDLETATFEDTQMVEVAVDKAKLAEFQFSALAVRMVIDGKTLKGHSDLMGAYRKLNKASKDWLDGHVDKIWASHEEQKKALEDDSGNSEG